jgi:hypothetical protein
MKVVIFTAPAGWATGLLYGDTSGLSEEEEAELDECVADLVATHGSAHVCAASDPEFLPYGWDYGSLAGDYCTYTITIDNKETR